MTREEALTEWVMPAIRRTWNEKKCDEILKALEQETCDAVSRKAAIDACLKGLNRKEMVANIKALPSVHPECTEDYCPAAFKPTECEDCVSRDAVLEALYDHEYKKDIRKDIEALPSVQPKQTECEDCVSRQAAIDAMYGMHMNGKEGVLYDHEHLHGIEADFANTIWDAVEELEQLPSVKPKEKVRNG